MNEGESQAKVTQGLENKPLQKTFGGLCIDKEIWIAPSTAVQYIKRLSHEIGHTFEDDLSFRNDVLTPDEVKKCVLRIKGFDKADKIYKKVKDTDTLLSSFDYLNDLVFNAVNEFTKGKFDPKKITIHTNVPEEEIKDIIRRAGGSITTIIGLDGEEIETNTKLGRNTELSAITTQYAVRTILQNTLDMFGYKVKWWQEYETDAKSHYRAERIVKRAYQNKVWILPSIKDIKTSIS